MLKQPEENSVEDVKLKSRELTVDVSHPDYPKPAIHVFATNAEAGAWNNILLNNLDGESYIYVADDSRKDKTCKHCKSYISRQYL